MKIIKWITVSVFLFFWQNNIYAQTTTELVSKMINAINDFKTGKYVIDKIERIGDHNNTSEMIVKVQASPFKAYSYCVKPIPGIEILYVSGWNNNNAYIKPNQFPYVNLSLNPFGSTLRKDEHHTIPDMGFSYLGNILSDNIVKRTEEFYSSLSSDNEAEWKGKSYYKLTIDVANFGYVNYKVLNGENIYYIGKKLHLSDYMILSYNHLSDFDDVSPGQVIKVPNSYAKKIELYLDKDNYLPLVQIIYDEKGLFEQYEYNSFVLNPVISPEEFTPTYKDYKF